MGLFPEKNADPDFRDPRPFILIPSTLQPYYVKNEIPKVEKKYWTWSCKGPIWRAWKPQNPGPEIFPEKDPPYLLTPQTQWCLQAWDSCSLQAHRSNSSVWRSGRPGQTMFPSSKWHIHTTLGCGKIDQNYGT